MTSVAVALLSIPRVLLDRIEMKLSFLDLPPEIRNKLYEELFVSKNGLTIKPDRTRCRRLQNNKARTLNLQSLNILRTCKKIHEEGASVLYSSHTFHFDDRKCGTWRHHDTAETFPLCDLTVFQDFLLVIGARNKKNIRKLHLELYGSALLVHLTSPSWKNGANFLRMGLMSLRGGGLESVRVTVHDQAKDKHTGLQLMSLSPLSGLTASLRRLAPLKYFHVDLIVGGDHVLDYTDLRQPPKSIPKQKILSECLRHLNRTSTILLGESEASLPGALNNEDEDFEDKVLMPDDRMIYRFGQAEPMQQQKDTRKKDEETQSESPEPETSDDSANEPAQNSDTGDGDGAESGTDDTNTANDTEADVPTDSEVTNDEQLR